MDKTKGKKFRYWQIEYWLTCDERWDSMPEWCFKDEQQALANFAYKLKKEPQFHWRIVRHDTEVTSEHIPKK